MGFAGISDAGASTETELTESGHDVLFCQGDMAVKAFCERVVERVLARWGRIDCLVNVDNLTRCMALGLAPYNIRVNSVSPGWIWTREVYKAAEIGGGGRAKWEPVR